MLPSGPPAGAAARPPAPAGTTQPSLSASNPAGTYAGPGNVNLTFPAGVDVRLHAAAGPEGTTIDCRNQTRAFAFRPSDGKVEVKGAPPLLLLSLGRGAVCDLAQIPHALLRPAAG